MEAELFGQVLNDDELEDELAKLDAIIVDEMIPSAATGHLEPIEAPKQKVAQ